MVMPFATYAYMWNVDCLTQINRECAEKFLRCALTGTDFPLQHLRVDSQARLPLESCTIAA
jgi:hypothetical protein